MSLLEDVLKRVNIFQKDWESLVPAVRYSFIFSLILLLFIWLDKTLLLNFIKSLYENPHNWQRGNIYFLIANAIILILFVLLILERFWVNLKIVYYKLKYPLRNLNKDFYIISFQGRVCLLDIKSKQLRWLKNWQTALDLDFIGEWTDVDDNITHPFKLIDMTFNTKDGAKIELKNFKYVNGIHTQGLPGT